MLVNLGFGADKEAAPYRSTMVLRCLGNRSFTKNGQLGPGYECLGTGFPS